MATPRASRRRCSVASDAASSVDAAPGVGLALVASAAATSAPLTARGETVRVRVMARVRPFLPLELVGPRKGINCIEVVSPTIAVGKSCFTFDHVFGPDSSQEDVYVMCVEPLVDATFEGVNGTLLAYGQTGSGKTFTMGTSGLGGVPDGALQRAVRSIFARASKVVEEERGSVAFRVSFVEIFTDSSRHKCNEEIRCLLSPGHSQVFATIKTDTFGQMRLEGIVEHEVTTEEETLNLLALGSASRATCATRLNESSSRSHAIFTLEVVQRKFVAGAKSLLTSKFQFVDLAGSERVKLSGVEGDQLSQAININHGLFVLGKAITALTDKLPHVPFRESKLTRLLQNSLGGNSRTCMLACVSPSDANLAETVAALTYAAKAKEIKNKPVVNREMPCSNCALLQARIDALERQTRPAESGGVLAPLDVDALGHCSQAASTRLERFSAYNARGLELEKENVKLRNENRQLQEQLEDSKGCSESQAGLEAAQAQCARYKALYRRCSERLVALQKRAQAIDLSNSPLDESVLEANPDISDWDAEVAEEAVSEEQLAALEEGVNSSDEADLKRLNQETWRKEQLLLQVEENQMRMAVLEAQSKQRIRQHEAARDIAERELMRLQSELEQAKNRAEHLQGLQERYDAKLLAVKEQRAKLDKELRDNQRLRGIQKQQEVRLRVLQDSIRQVKEERDDLKGQLRGELRRRKEQEAQGRIDQAKIRTMGTRIADLERARRNSVTPSSSSSSRVAERSSGRRACSKEHTAQGGPWLQLLREFAERQARERRLGQARARLVEAEAAELQARAQLERQAMENEVDGSDRLESLEDEVRAVTAAVEYLREQVWLLSRELGGSSSAGGLEEAASRLAKGLRPEDYIPGLLWLFVETATQTDALAQAQESLEVAEADAALSCQALAESQQRVTELERLFDAARGEYESRVAYLISRCGVGPWDGSELREVLGEDATVLLNRRIGELEEQLSRHTREAKEKGQRRFEQDIELISSYGEQGAENRRLRAQVVETSSALKRAVGRAATREAQFLEQISRLQAELASRAPRDNGAVSGPEATAEVTWGLKILEEFWWNTGLDSHRDEMLLNLKADVEALCEERLAEHLEWKNALQERTEQLHSSLIDVCAKLGETPETPPPGENLLQKVQHLEASISSMASLRQRRAEEAEELEERIKQLHVRLHGAPVVDEVVEIGRETRLHATTIARVRARTEELERLERSRKANVATRLSELQQLWDAIGLDEQNLEVIEREFLCRPLPVSDLHLQYLEERMLQLATWRDNLEPEECDLRMRLLALKEKVANLGLPLPDAPQGLPLLLCVQALRASIDEAEDTVKTFVGEARAQMNAFARDTQLRNIIDACEQLQAVSAVSEELDILNVHWERLSAQTKEHARISELITSREALEKEMRAFDMEASDPDRFKKRGYSGIQESKVRADYQRRLRLLDASITQSTAEWLQREGVAFRYEGAQYRGTEILPVEHTHMYAWTLKQVAQKQSSQTLSPAAVSTQDERLGSSSKEASALLKSRASGVPPPHSAPSLPGRGGGALAFSPRQLTPRDSRPAVFLPLSPQSPRLSPSGSSAGASLEANAVGDGSRVISRLKSFSAPRRHSFEGRS